MTLLKLLFLPIYLPFVIIFEILKLIGAISFANDVIDFFD